MCGICGAFSFEADPNHARREAIVASMCTAIRHRGPDEAGVWVDDHAAVGSRRLSIIDIADGQQPMTSDDQQVVIVYNGEIYNYISLRNKLLAQGRAFHTQSDTEVVLQMYQEYGPECVRQLNGIFAFAIWDARQRRLLLARDQFGIKPLFYSALADGIIFGSELKALLQHPAAPRGIDWRAIGDFLSLNYIPSPRTALAAARALPPAHYALCTADNVIEQRYWDFRFRADMDGQPAHEIAAALQTELRQAVLRQLVADVPVGAFLSGGIDSSSVVALMSAAEGARLQTFNVTFGEPSYDESEAARKVAAHFGAEHHEVMCRPEHLAELLPVIARQADNPLADISMLPMYLLSRLAGSHLKVVLSGDGADELFAGYPTYKASRLAHWYRRLPALARERLAPAMVNRLPPSERKMSIEMRLRRFVQAANLPAQQAHANWRVIFTEAERVLLLHPDVTGALNGVGWNAYGHLEHHEPGQSNLDWQQYADINVWLSGSILPKVDGMSMAHSLEVRVPFLDRELAEFAAGIPANLRLRRLTEKYVLREAMAPLLPRSIATRRKAGFNIPLGAWLRGPLRAMLQETLSPDTLRQVPWLRAAFVNELLAEHLSGRHDHAFKLLGLMTLIHWRRAYRSIET